MVKPINSEMFGIKTLEERIAERFDDLQHAREEQDGPSFDALVRTIEVLLMGRPEVYQELMYYKNDLGTALKSRYQEIQKAADNAEDIVQHDAILKKYGQEAEWSFRERYEEIMMQMMTKGNLVVYTNPPRVRIQQQPQSQPEDNLETDESNVSIEKEPEPKPKTPPTTKTKRKTLAEQIEEAKKTNDPLTKHKFIT